MIVFGAPVYQSTAKAIEVETTSSQRFCIKVQNFAFELLLSQHPDQKGKLVLVQIANPARGRGKDLQEVQAETYATVKRINQKFGRTGYEPVILVDKPLQFYERIAYYAVAECCLVTALDATLGLNPTAPKKSMLVVSVFIGCSPSLSGAIRVNPWNIDVVSEAMDSALIVSEAEKQMRHEKHYKYVCTHDVAYWAQSFWQDLERACRDHVRRRCWGIGFGLGFRVVALDPSFRKLSVEHIVSAYKRTKHRAILLDYDGTMTVRNSISKGPNAEVISILNSFCRDPKNIVFIVSGKDTKTLTQWFSSCETLGLAISTADNFRRN
ncbi:alpha,alpha-trehalose-phosphate synthase [UDP-forming] 5-like [Solanum verrucosum]|uniref:alpha,alpha-trehalose-phosphate synthase [UDP-forming] 5-like n=1 Tax=Solanum verrucosum TaxID=315347 RepID=UPI0020D05F07|nr:alpha,alpha-trehalose-phosphate synthase [UDP-forming] 5-like [Solanum verrucosum]